SHLPRVDEEHLASAVAEAVVALVAREKPQAHGNLSGVKELPGQRDHAVDEVSLDDCVADVALARRIRRHGTISEHEAGVPVRRAAPLALHEPADGAAAGLVDAPLIRSEHRGRQLHYVVRRIQLPAVLTLAARELPQEVLVHTAEHVLRLSGITPDLDVADQA